GVLSFAHVHAATYVSLLRDRPDVELIAADPDADHDTSGELRGAAMAEQLGIRLLGSYADVMAARPDAVVICSENSRHRPLVELAATAGAHVLCEKPIATTLEDATAMIGACRNAGVVLMPAYPVRFHPAFTVLRENVRAGRLGRILAAAGTNNGRAPIASRRWFVDAELAGGGAFMDHIVHLADLLDHLRGEPAVEVYAQSNRIVHENEVDVETGGLVAVTYADGMVATIDCSWNRPATATIGGGLTLYLEGEHGSAGFDTGNQSLTLFDDVAGGISRVGYGPDLDALMLQEFLTAIAEGRPAQPDGDTGLRTLQIVLAAQESDRTGQPVRI
ncbi:MAG TPA: Gfo/Idh/MocA family oxidoreductase, partial [Mycobacteriales bacterium]|nr:Gfo/Idh/MocA family oxidoreductase [Mycobacteriales bacterium]